MKALGRPDGGKKSYFVHIDGNELFYSEHFYAILEAMLMSKPLRYGHTTFGGNDHWPTPGRQIVAAFANQLLAGCGRNVEGGLTQIEIATSPLSIANIRAMMSETGLVAQYKRQFCPYEML